MHWLWRSTLAVALGGLLGVVWFILTYHFPWERPAPLQPLFFGSLTHRLDIIGGAYAVAFLIWFVPTIAVSLVLYVVLSRFAGSPSTDGDNSSGSTAAAGQVRVPLWGEDRFRKILALGCSLLALFILAVEVNASLRYYHPRIWLKGNQGPMPWIRLDCEFGRFIGIQLIRAAAQPVNNTEGGDAIFFRWTTGAVYKGMTPIAARHWHLQFPPWVALGLCLIYPAIAFVHRPLARRRKRNWRQQGRCVHCGYHLTGNTSGVCPECGEQV